ncbi:putative transcription factor C2H2 family [Rosa chinensis]|uniref:Putative transcription factor C2H2 family n=1 Tax=Rosa chinensis TaxID=74649 RepID=A0A2P6QNU0_ROSCH|nr:putative transcription factor C2H2 family [Rosa chinensis]
MIVHETNDKLGENRVLDYIETTRHGTCVICMDDFNVGRDASRLPCLHIFHRNCIVDWLRRNHNCPICRHSMPPALITWL